MEEANKTQIGGDHYRSVYQHWDFVENNGIGYLEGCATKYVTRWRRKEDGREDLKKALHYIDKLRELHRKINRMPRGVASYTEINGFNEANKLTQNERSVIFWLCRWRDDEDLVKARGHVEQLLLEPAPLPLEQEPPVAVVRRDTEDHPFGFDKDEDIGP